LFAFVSPRTEERERKRGGKGGNKKKSFFRVRPVGVQPRKRKAWRNGVPLSVSPTGGQTKKKGSRCILAIRIGAVWEARLEDRGGGVKGKRKREETKKRGEGKR